MLGSLCSLQRQTGTVSRQPWNVASPLCRRQPGIRYSASHWLLASCWPSSTLPISHSWMDVLRQIDVECQQDPVDKAWLVLGNSWPMSQQTTVQWQPQPYGCLNKPRSLVWSSTDRRPWQITSYQTVSLTISSWDIWERLNFYWLMTQRTCWSMPSSPIGWTAVTVCYVESDSIRSDDSSRSRTPVSV